MPCCYSTDVDSRIGDCASEIDHFDGPAALRPMSTAGLVIAQAIYHFDGDPSLHVKTGSVDSATM